MLEVVLSLIPLSLGIVLSPLAIMALVAVLLSQRARANGVGFLIGWAVAIIVLLGVSFAIFALLGVTERADPPPWVAVVRLILAVVLIVAAVFIFRRGRTRIVAMAHASTPHQVVDAAPQLPGWLRAVDTFTPARSSTLGFGIFALNPVDASCAILAALDIRLGDLDTTQSVVISIVFVALGILPIAIPVFLTITKGEKAAPVLAKLRRWIASHTTDLNAALLLFIALLQIQKGISGLLG